MRENTDQNKSEYEHFLRSVMHFFIRTNEILMRFNVLIFCRFSASKCSYFVLIFIGNIECLKTTLEDYKVIYPNGTSDYIIKDYFDGVLVILFNANF